MGRLYQKTVSGEKSLAHFAGGRVRCGRHSGGAEICYNSIGQIYYDGLDHVHSIVATCDIGGNIYKGSGAAGSILAKCEDGKIYESGSRRDKILAWYDGDMYGAAAAVITVLGLDGQ